MIDAAGTLWILISVVGAVILALGLFYASQQARDAPRDAVTLRLKREKTRENFSGAAVEEKPIFGEGEAKPDLMKAEIEQAEVKKEVKKPVKVAAKKRRPRVARQSRSRRSEARPSSHAVH